jgi:hypothetical protein
MTICQSCGSQSANETSKFCGSCGSAHNVTEPPQPKQPAIPKSGPTPFPYTPLPPNSVNYDAQTPYTPLPPNSVNYDAPPAYTPLPPNAVDYDAPKVYTPLPSQYIEYGPKPLNWPLTILIWFCTFGLFTPVLMYLQYESLKKLNPGLARPLQPWVVGGMIAHLCSYLLWIIFFPFAYMAASGARGTLAYQMIPVIEDAYRAKGISRKLSVPCAVLGGCFYIQYHLCELANQPLVVRQPPAPVPAV